MKKIILKSGFTFYQKTMLVLVFLATFTIGAYMFLLLMFKLLKVPEYDYEFTGIFYFFLLFLPLSFFILLILLSKDGILITDDKALYKAKFIFGKNWFKQKADLNGITDITILSLKGTQNFAPFTFALPDKKYDVYNNEIYLLNHNHTIKRFLISTRDKKLAEKTINEINEVLNLNYKSYNPRFYD